jgi:hypothetical protein
MQQAGRVATSTASALVCAVVLGVAGCGGSNDGIEPEASEVLQAQVASARAAVAAGDPVRATQLLQAVDDTVASLRAEHAISDRKAADVLAALGDTQDALHAWIASSTTTTTTTTTTSAPPTDDDRGKDQGGEDDDRGPGGGHGKRGNGDDD